MHDGDLLFARGPFMYLPTLSYRLRQGARAFTRWWTAHTEDSSSAAQEDEETSHDNGPAVDLPVTRIPKERVQNGFSPLSTGRAGTNLLPFRGVQYGILPWDDDFDVFLFNPNT